MSIVEFNTLTLTDISIVFTGITITSDIFQGVVSDSTQNQKIQASDRDYGDRFGRSCSLNFAGNVGIVGSHLADNGITIDAGAAYIFTKDSSDIWSEQQLLQISDVEINVRFGYCVDLDGDGNTAVISAHNKDSISPIVIDGGAAYVFTKDSSDIWNETQKLIASDISTLSAFSRAAQINTSGTVMILGAPLDGTIGVNAGAAYIFTKDSSDIWNEQQRLESSDLVAGDQFGNDVAINNNGNLVIIGADREATGGTDAGAAYIFTKDSSDIWNEQQKIQSSDIAAYDRLGRNVSINGAGDTALLSCRCNDNGNNSGGFYVFTKDSSDIWNEQQKLLSSDGSANDNFGHGDVAINNDGDIAMIGAYGEDTGYSNAGASYIFAKNLSDVWSEQMKIQASDPGTGSRFGRSTSLNGLGDISLITAFRDSTPGSDVGSAYIFNNTLSVLNTVLSDITGVSTSDLELYEIYRESDGVLRIVI